MSPVPAARCGAGLRGEAGVAFCQGTVPTCGSVYMAIDPQAPLGPERAQRRGHVRPPWKMAKEPKVSQLLSRDPELCFLLRPGAKPTPSADGLTEPLLGPQAPLPPARPESPADLLVLSRKAKTRLL